MSSKAGSSKEKVDKKVRPRACDQCRRRKVRCNGGEIPIGSRCANCIAFEYECTYTAPSSKRPIDADYVKSLESEVAELKRQLHSMTIELSDSSVRRSPTIDRSALSSPQVLGSSANSPSSLTTPTSPVLGSDVQNVPQDETEAKEELVELLHSMNINVKHTHYIGRSSSLVFVRAAVAIKREFASSLQDPNFDHARRDMFTARQPEFWHDMTELIQPQPPHPLTVFPESTLMHQLVDEYFHRMNVICPLLHRPTFEHGIKTGLHLRDEGFGSVVLLVCALGSKYSNNPAVLPTGIKSWYWAGWHWFQHVNSSRKFVHVSAPSVYDLQICFLFATYLAASPVPHAIFSMLGHGVRLALDMGAHRRMAYGTPPTIEDELKKRALWCLVVMDRSMCDKLGRPYNVEDEDFEVDLPVECDDEHWAVDSQGKVTFAQPPGKPSKIAAFNCMIRLTRIQAEGFKTIYYSNPGRLRSDPEHAQRVVSELDSQLNDFIDSMPEHLRWSPHRDAGVFTNQSAFIHSCYYFVQILTHRAFVPLPGRPSPVSFPSLAICTNAARSALHIFDVQYTKIQDVMFPQAHWYPMTIFTCATVLLINLWNARRVGLATDTAKDLRDVQRADHILSQYEKRWIGAARLGYILHDVVEVITALTDEQRKRKRDVYDEAPGTGPSTVLSATEPAAQRPRPSPEAAFPALSAAPAPAPDAPFVLPVHSAELGRLPVWPDLDGSHPLYGNLWPQIDGEAFVDTTGIYGGDPGLQDFGPEFESVFANLFPEIGYGVDAGQFEQGGGGIDAEQMQTGVYMPAGYAPGSETVAGALGTTSYPAPSASQSMPGSSMFDTTRR